MFRKITLFSLSLILFTCLKGFSQQYKWGKMFDGNSVGIIDVAFDNSGNKYIIGGMNPWNSGGIDSTNLATGSGTHIINTNNGARFYAKYDANDSFIWGRQIDAAFFKIRMTPTGQLLMAANISENSNVDFDPGPATVALTAYGNDLVMATYSSIDGSFVSVKQFQTFEYQANSGNMWLGATNVSVNSIDVDSQGNIYLVGSGTGAIDLDLNGNFTNTYNFSNATGYFLKYNSNFDLLAGYIAPKAGMTALQYDPSLQYTYVLGNYGTLSSGGISLYKFDGSANVVWNDSIPISNGTIIPGTVEDMNIDAGGNLYIHGLLPLDGSINFQSPTGTIILDGPPLASGSSQATNGYLAKYKTNGQVAWAKKIQGASGAYNSIERMKIDNNNKLVCMIGIVNGSLNIGNNTADTTGMFLALYDTAANLLQYKNMLNTYGAPVPYFIEMKLHNKDIYFYGTFKDSIDFDPLTPLGRFTQLNHSASGSGAGFLVRYNQCKDNFTSVSASMCLGSTYQFGTQILNAPGNYFNQFGIGNECDSMVSLQLSVTNVDTAVTKANNVLTANATGATYQWLNCANNTPIQGAIGNTYTPSVSGSYKVVVTKNGCSDTSNCYNVNITSINQPEFAKHVIIYPNPAQNNLFVTLGKTARVDEISVTDLAGRVLQTIKVAPMANSIVIDVEKLNTGIYILKLTSGNEKASFKFVKK